MSLNSRRVIFQPATYRRMQRGVNKIADAIRPTLGPRPRIVAINRILDERAPELLDNGGTIAQRIQQMADPDEDMGAQLVRNMLWRLQDQVGDGTATAAVLFQTIYNGGIHYLAAGGNAMRLNTYLQQGMRLILDELAGMTQPLSGKDRLARMAEAVCFDPSLAAMLGEIFDIVGEYGRVEIRPGRGRELEREYVEGMYWEWGLMSRQMIVDHARLRTELESPAILISDLEIDDPRQLFRPLEMCLRAKVPALIVVAARLSESAIAFLAGNRKTDQFQVIAVKTPGWDRFQQQAALEDMAVLSGGRPFIAVAGDTFERFTLEDLGHARRAWADLRTFGFAGGQGDPRALRRHIATLRAAFNRTEEPVLRDSLLARIGKLLGGSATLWIGAGTEMEIKARQELAERTAATVRGAMMEGAVPGGGVALLACRPRLQHALDEADDPDARAAYRILLKAAAEPFRAITGNAGYDPSEVFAELKQAGPRCGFDVVAGRVVNVDEQGLYDAAGVLKAAVYGAISSAALALTVDVLIHRREQPRHAEVHTPEKRKRL